MLDHRLFAFSLQVAVETYGSMEKKEKAEIILEQMRLTMRQRDFVRMGILANKINKKVGQLHDWQIRRC